MRQWLCRNSVHARVQAWWLNAAIERAAHFADALASLLLPQQNSATGTRTRVARVRAEYPNQLDYSGSANLEMVI